MSNDHVFLACVVALVFAYPVVAGLILRGTESVRLELADTGRALLQDPKISERHKVFISDMLDDVFDWRFMAYATFMFPYVALSNRSSRDLDEADRKFFKDEQVGRFVDLHIRAVMAASPIFTALFIAVAIVTILMVIAWCGFSVLNFIWADTVKQISPSTGGHHRMPVHRIVE